MSVPAWLLECIDEVNALSKQLTTADAIQQRARAYSFDVAAWLQKVETPGDRERDDPRSMLAHDCAVIPASIYQALAGPSGSSEPATVALRCIDRSRRSWMSAVERRLASAEEVARFLSELDALRHELERLFPQAHS